MKILFPIMNMPAAAGSSNLYLDLAQELARRGHEVHIIGALSDAGRTEMREAFGCKLLAVKTFRQRGVKNIFRKGFAHAALPWQFKRAYDRFYGDTQFDVVFMPTPPVTLVNFVEHVMHRSGAKFYLILRDIHPQEAVDLGLMKGRLMYNYLRRLEKKTYRLADLIGCMSPGNVDYILRHNPEVEAQKLVLLPNWQKEVHFDAPRANEELKKAYGLAGKFVILFGGTIGYAQKVENIVDLATYCARYDDVRIVVIGQGVKKKHLQTLVEEQKLENVLFFDTLPRDEYLKFARSADVGLITIDERFTVPTIPSKTVSYFNLSLPVLAVIDPHTDYPRMLEEADAGLWSLGGDKQGLSENFETYYRDRELCDRMGRNGYDYFIKNLTVGKACDTVLAQIAELEH